MIEFASETKMIPHNRQLVYDTLSNMENVVKVIHVVTGSSLKNLTFDRDECSFAVQQIGQVQVAIVNREEPHVIRWTIKKLPIPLNLQLELLSETENETAIRTTASSDAPTLMKSMLTRLLQEGVNKATDALTIIPYDKL